MRNPRFPRNDHRAGHQDEIGVGHHGITDGIAVGEPPQTHECQEPVRRR